MAVRLNVIMVHGTPQTANAQRLAESIVGELIAVAGIDLTLIDQLEQIQPTSTDYLTLDSISGEVAVLDWQPHASIVESLRAVGFHGSRAHHAHDLAADNADDTRRIYAFDLTEFDDAQGVIGALAELLASRQVRTVSLGSLLPNKPQQPNKTRLPEKTQLPDKTAQQPTPAAAAGSSSPPDPISPHKTSNAPNPPAAPLSGGETPAGDSEPDPQPRPRKTLDLDALVDQLDLLDQ